MFLKLDTVSVIPSAGCGKGPASLLMHFNGWRTLVDRVPHAGNEREVHLSCVPNVKFDTYCA